jgi:hypothetical protein
VTATKINSRFHVKYCCLLLLLSAIHGEAQKNPTGIDVKLNAQEPLQLRITVRSLAKTRATIYKSDLPWGLRDSIILVAVLPNGESLEQNVISGDASIEKISLESNESVSGGINLKNVFKNLDVAIRKSDIHLFWAYRPPNGLNLPRWSGGWILLSRQSRE